MSPPDDALRLAARRLDDRRHIGFERLNKPIIGGEEIPAPPPTLVAVVEVSARRARREELVARQTCENTI